LNNVTKYDCLYNDHQNMAVIIWPLLRFRISYRCGYCVGVCPAGEEPQEVHLQDKKAYVQQVVKPLQDEAEPVYVLAGSKAESAAKRNPRKQVKIV